MTKSSLLITNVCTRFWELLRISCIFFHLLIFAGKITFMKARKKCCIESRKPIIRDGRYLHVLLYATLAECMRNDGGWGGFSLIFIVVAVGTLIS